MMARHPRDQPVSNMLNRTGNPHLWASSCVKMGRLLRIILIARKTQPIQRKPYPVTTARGAFLVALDTTVLT
jgi:hypothetical protein